VSVRHLVVMGVSGSGKSTIGERLADRLAVPFAEGDDFHSDASRATMAAGIPLTDDDRGPWLRSLRDWMTAQAGRGRGTVVACSALRRAYRDVLRDADGWVVPVHVAVRPPLLSARMHQRVGHYMPTSLLGTQLAALEPLETDELGVTVDAEHEADHVVSAIIDALETLDRGGEA
jgi:gluconokinase